MPRKAPISLGRRERQILEVVCRLGRANVNEVLDHLPDPPSYSSVRTMLGILERKGHLKHEVDGPRFVYVPAVRPATMGRSAMRHMVETFFNGSVGAAATALLESSHTPLSDEDLERLTQLIARSRAQGR